MTLLITIAVTAATIAVAVTIARLRADAAAWRNAYEDERRHHDATCALLCEADRAQTIAAAQVAMQGAQGAQAQQVSRFSVN